MPSRISLNRNWPSGDTNFHVQVFAVLPRHAYGQNAFPKVISIEFLPMVYYQWRGFRNPTSRKKRFGPFGIVNLNGTRVTRSYLTINWPSGSHASSVMCLLKYLHLPPMNTARKKSRTISSRMFSTYREKPTELRLIPSFCMVFSTSSNSPAVRLMRSNTTTIGVSFSSCPTMLMS